MPSTSRDPQTLRKPGCYAKANYANVPHLQDLHPKLLHDSHDRRPVLETPLYALKDDGPLRAQGGRQVRITSLSPPKRTF